MEPARIYRSRTRAPWRWRVARLRGSGCAAGRSQWARPRLRPPGQTLGRLACLRLSHSPARPRASGAATLLARESEHARWRGRVRWLAPLTARRLRGQARRGATGLLRPRRLCRHRPCHLCRRRCRRRRRLKRTVGCGARKKRPSCRERRRRNKRRRISKPFPRPSFPPPFLPFSLSPSFLLPRM